MKRQLSLILSALLVSFSLVSCSESDVNTDEKNTDAGIQSSDNLVVEEEEESAKYIDSLPETMDFEGAEIRFLLEEGHGGPLTEQSIYVDEDTGEVVDSAVYNRNIVVNDRLNTSISIVEMLSSGAVSPLLRSSVQSGGDDYDVVGVYQYYGASVGTSGMIFNLNSDRFQYFDFSRDYWGHDYMDNLTYKNNTPWCTGDLALRYIGGIYATYVNKRIWNDFYSETSIYDLVDNGEWTLDKMYEITSGVFIDTNGDGKKDANDIYGYTQSYDDPIDGLSAASLIRFSERDSEGVPYLALNNERTYAFYDKLYKLCSQNENEGFFKSPGWEDGLHMFAESKAMMHVSHILESGIYFREMDDDFAIIPVAKLDENQEYYNTMIHDGLTLFGVPITNTKIDATCALLEALSSESYRSVTPAYYDVALKVKYTRDSDAGRMMDIIREHVSSDFMGLYSNQLNNIIHFFRSSLSNNQSSIASSVEKQTKAWNKGLEKLLQSLEQNADN